MTEAERLAQALDILPAEDLDGLTRVAAAALIRAQAAELERRTTRYLAKTEGELVVELRILVNDAAKSPVFEGRWLAENSYRWCAAPPIRFAPGLQFEGFSFNPHVTTTPPLVIGTVKATP